MALLWFHNPDRYIPITSPAQNFVSMFWTTVGPAEVLVDNDGYDGAVSPGPGAGRLFCAPSSPPIDSYLIQGLTPADAQFRIGARFKVDELPTSPFMLMAVMDEDAATVQCAVAVNPDGTLSFYEGGMLGSPSGTVLRTSTTTITAGAWFRLGLKGKIHSTNGEGEIHLNSTRTVESIATRVTLVNTNPTGSGVWGGVYFGVSSLVSVSHMYANDGTGVRNNKLLPAAYVRSYSASYTPSPTYSGFTPSTGLAIDPMIDDQEPDLDATYIGGLLAAKYSTLVGEGTPAAIDTAVTTYGAQLTQVAGTINGDLSLIPLVVVEGATYTKAFTSPERLDLTSPDDWRAFRGLWADNPKTNKRWTTAKLEAAQWGAEVGA